LTYNRELAKWAHERGLSIALKNDLDQIKALVENFDFAINEECFQYAECAKLLPFINANKAVLGAEYTGQPGKFCPTANAMGFSTLKLPLGLDGTLRIDCQSPTYLNAPAVKSN
jgi:hypothetical protein